MYPFRLERDDLTRGTAPRANKKMCCRQSAVSIRTAPALARRQSTSFPIGIADVIG
jgi:hypothetical protein